MVLDQQDRDAAVADLRMSPIRSAVSLGFMPAAGSSSSSSFGSRGERAGDFEPPLVAVGEVLGEFVVLAGEPDEGEQLGGLLLGTRAPRGGARRG